MASSGRTREVVVDARDDGYVLDAGDGPEPLDAAGLIQAVRRLEQGRPRWVWDTARVYPALLEAGVRVERAWDLRLARALLRRAAGVRRDGGPPADGWDGAPAASDAGLLPIDVGSVPSATASAESARQHRVVAASERPGALRLLIAAESAGALAAAEMRHAGLPWSRPEHERLLESVLGPRPASGGRPRELERLLQEVRAALAAPGLNPDSPAELTRALRRAGIRVDSTRAEELRGVEHPAIAPLLEYRQRARLLTANGWHWLDEWVHHGRFRPEYVVGGVVTGRWAARGGGALQLPKQLRSAVVADEGWRLVVADAAQLEPRVLAGLARDRSMAEAGRGRDLYDGIVATGAVATRQSAKVGVLGALYGATSGDGGRLVPRLAQRFPRAIALVEEAARTGERGGSVHTLLGRGSPPPGDAHEAARAAAAEFDADDALLRRVRSLARDRGRFTRNFVVQGTAAEWALCWLADLRQRLWAIGEAAPEDGAPETRPHLVYFLHDEVIVHAPASAADAVAEAVRESAATAGRLLFDDFPVDFPLDVAVVQRYSDAA